MNLFNRIHLSSFQVISIGFLLVILTGALLLMLPGATVAPGSASFSDALFTSVSAVCVTGLVVQDTATYWTGFGQAVILTLIQIGGMGVVTLAVAITMISGKKISLMQRSTMQEAISAHHVGGIVRLTGFIIKVTVIIEVIGGLLLGLVFSRDFGILRGIWYGMFHSISAFCNAGFDLMGQKQPYSSLTAYAGDPLINLTIAGLIVIGGIGFLTWEDVRTNGWRLRRYRMQSKVILATTLLLILLPTLFFFLLEFSTPKWAEFTTGERFLASLFQAVTPRTAGFNTVNLGEMSESSLSCMIILMLTGGSPGSTAGGMKTTTIAVLFLSALSVFHRRETVRCLGRRIEMETVRNAAAILLMYLTLFLFGGLTISQLEGLPVLDCLFESASAIGTVGLSLGVTPNLSEPSRFILMALMFFGRVGGLTLIFAAASGKRKYVSTLPKEKITVG